MKLLFFFIFFNTDLQENLDKLFFCEVREKANFEYVYCGARYKSNDSPYPELMKMDWRYLDYVYKRYSRIDDSKYLEFKDKPKQLQSEFIIDLSNEFEFNEKLEQLLSFYNNQDNERTVSISENKMRETAANFFYADSLKSDNDVRWSISVNHFKSINSDNLFVEAFCFLTINRELFSREFPFFKECITYQRKLETEAEKQKLLGDEKLDFCRTKMKKFMMENESLYIILMKNYYEREHFLGFKLKKD